MLEHVRCLQPLDATSRHYYIRVLFPYQNKNAIWRHLCINIMNTDDAKVTWSVKWPEVMLAAYPVLLPFWLADEWSKFSIYTQRFFPKRGLRSHFIRLSSQRRTEDGVCVTLATFNQRRFDPHTVVWAVIVSKKSVHFFFWFQFSFLGDTFLKFSLNCKFWPDVS